MTMQYDVKSAQASESGTFFDGPARVKGVYVVCASTDGAIEIKDGGSSGTIRLTLDALADTHPYILLPGEGIRFTSSVYVAMSGGVSSVTVFYG